jgi:hypothetical protein
MLVHPSRKPTFIPIPCATGEFRKFLLQVVQAGQDLRILRSTNPGDVRYSGGAGGHEKKSVCIRDESLLLSEEEGRSPGTVREEPMADLL